MRSGSMQGFSWVRAGGCEEGEEDHQGLLRLLLCCIRSTVTEKGVELEMVGELAVQVIQSVSQPGQVRAGIVSSMWCWAVLANEAGIRW